MHSRAHARRQSSRGRGEVAPRRAAVHVRAAFKRVSETHDGVTVEHGIDESGKWLAEHPQKGGASERIVERLQGACFDRRLNTTHI